MEADAAEHRAQVEAHARSGRQMGAVFAALVAVGIVLLWVAVGAGRETPRRAAVVTGMGVALVTAGAWWQRRSEIGERALLDRSWSESIEGARVIEIDTMIRRLVVMDELVLCDVGEGWWLLLDDAGGMVSGEPGTKLRYRSVPGRPTEASLVGSPVPVAKASFDWTALPDGHPMAEAEPPVFYRAEGDPIAGIIPFSHGWVMRAEG